MKLKTLYLVLCVVGVVLPYWQFVPWLAGGGVANGRRVFDSAAISVLARAETGEIPERDENCYGMNPVL